MKILSICGSLIFKNGLNPNAGIAPAYGSFARPPTLELTLELL